MYLTKDLYLVLKKLLKLNHKKNTTQFKEEKNSWVCWCTLVILALGRLRQGEWRV
jgi:hypothetical protein